VSKEGPFELISDLGSGVNFKKRGLKKLLKLILHGNVKKLVLCHQDRLLRFGNELIYLLCDHFSIEVELIEEKEAESDEIKLARDVITIITVFSSRLYGKRGHEKRKARLLASS
jgi:predicted site-specific integrase-resolvase